MLKSVNVKLSYLHRHVILATFRLLRFFVREKT